MRLLSLAWRQGEVLKLVYEVETGSVVEAEFKATVVGFTFCPGKGLDQSHCGRGSKTSNGRARLGSGNDPPDWKSFAVFYHIFTIR